MAVSAENCPQCGGAIKPGYGTQITCQYCGSSLVRLIDTPAQNEGGATGSLSPDQDGVAKNTWGIRMKRATHTDLKSGLVAFHWLIPADWEFQADIWWRDSVTLPAIPSFRAWNPNGPEQIEWLPTIPNIWRKNILSEAFSKWTPKSRFFKEDGIEQRAPMTSSEVLRNLVLPRYRGRPEGLSEKSLRSSALTGIATLIGDEKIRQRMELINQIPGIDSVKKHFKNLLSPRYKPYGVTLRIIEEEPLPKLAQSLRGGEEDIFNPLSSDGARIRIIYDYSGNQMEEDIFCVVSKVVTQTGSKLAMQENIFWTAEALYAFRASAGHLDAVGQACMASVKSFRMNPQWLQFCRAESQRIIAQRRMMAQMMQQMAANQRRSLQQIGELSHSISDASDSIMDGYFERSAAYDRMADNYSEAIRGVDSYIDPTSDYSPQLPGGYDHAWSNGLGEYVVSNDHLFDPNLYSTGNWQQMQRQR